MLTFRAFLFGLILTAITAATSAAVALWGFRRLYYLEQLLPVFMASYLAVAWFVHLRRTGLLQKPAGETRKPAPGPEEPKPQVEGLLQNPIPVLVWSAAQLAVLATIVYHAFGVGATY